MSENIDIFIINSENRINRLCNIINILRDVNLSDKLCRIEALNQADAKLNQFSILSKKTYKNINSHKNICMICNYSCLAYSMSHIKTWRYIVDKSITESFIISDNIKILDKNLFKIELRDIYRIINKKKSKPLFLTINSIQINNSQSNFYCYDNEYIEKINEPFINLHFYYINIEMATYFLDSLNMLNFPIDIEIGLLSKKNRFGNKNFYNYKSKIIKKDENFTSDFDFYKYTPKSLSIVLKIPKDICSIIIQFISKYYKMNRFNLYNLYSSNLI